MPVAREPKPDEDVVESGVELLVPERGCPVVVRDADVEGFVSPVAELS